MRASRSVLLVVSAVVAAGLFATSSPAMAASKSTKVKTTASPVSALPAPTVDPGAVAAGKPVTVTGTACLSGGEGRTTVLVSLVDSLGDVLASSSRAPKSSGQWTDQLVVPLETPPGSYQLDSTCDQYTTQEQYPAVALQVTKKISTPWSLQTTANVLAPQAALSGVDCVTSTDCIAAGYILSATGAEEASVENWNGTKWTHQAVPVPAAAVGDYLTSVSCSSASNCLAVGQYQDVFGSSGVLQPLAETWDGSKWSSVSLPVPAGDQLVVLSVSCGPDGCEVVGIESASAGSPQYEPGTAVAEAWSGSSFTSQTVPVPAGATESGLNGVACEANGCQAVGWSYNSSVGESPLAEVWNGQIWSLESLAPPDSSDTGSLASVSCASSTCEAVGSGLDADGFPTPFAEGYDGSRWALQTFPLPAADTYPDVDGVTCTTTCEAVGSYYNPEFEQTPLAEAWNGKTWKAQKAPGQGGLGAVSCAGGSCEAVGTDIGFTVVPLVDRFTGTAWATGAAAATSSGAEADGLSAVDCASGSCVAVGYTGPGFGSPGGVLAETSKGKTWTTTPVPLPSGSTVGGLSSVACAASTCEAVGDYDSDQGPLPLAEVWNGTAWSLQSIPLPPSGIGGSLSGVSCGSDSCEAVGSYDTFSGTQPLAEVLSGGAWTPQVVPGPNQSQGTQLNAVSCDSTGCEAVGSWFNSKFEQRALAELWNGTSWTIQSTPVVTGVSSQLSGVSCVSASCTAVGGFQNDSYVSAALVEVWNGSKWSLQKIPSPPSTVSAVLSSVSCTTTSCEAVGYDYGLSDQQAAWAESWDGVKWTSQPLPTPLGQATVLDGVSCSASASCVTVGTALTGPNYETTAYGEGGA